MTLIMLQVGNAAGGPAVGQSMALATFAFFHLFIALETRFPRQTGVQPGHVQQPHVQHHDAGRAAQHVPGRGMESAQQVFGTGDLDGEQWVLCFLAALPLLLLWEIAKFVQRRRIAAGKMEAPEW